MLEHLTTEQRNPDSMELDRLSVEEILELMNREDQKVLAAVHKALPQIGQVVEQWVQRMPRGGRLIYLGAGTSGRIGQLDAVECPPTFGLDPSRVVGILAGQGDPSQAKEEAEDSPQLGRQALLDLNPTPPGSGGRAGCQRPHPLRNRGPGSGCPGRGCHCLHCVQPGQPHCPDGAVSHSAGLRPGGADGLHPA